MTQSYQDERWADIHKDQHYTFVYCYFNVLKYGLIDDFFFRRYIYFKGKGENLEQDLEKPLVVGHRNRF